MMHSDSAVRLERQTDWNDKSYRGAMIWGRQNEWPWLRGPYQRHLALTNRRGDLHIPRGVYQICDKAQAAARAPRRSLSSPNLTRIVTRLAVVFGCFSFSLLENLQDHNFICPWFRCNIWCLFNACFSHLRVFFTLYIWSRASGTKIARFACSFQKSVQNLLRRRVLICLCSPPLASYSCLIWWRELLISAPVQIETII